MHRLQLTAPELAGLHYLPGQDMMLLVGVEGNRPVRRRYTIRDLDTARQSVTLDVVRHGDGPGEQWVSAAQPGDTIEGIAPRGKITTSPDADWHLFIGDESALPAIFVMAESLPAERQAVILLEIPEAADEQPLAAKAGVSLRWLPRQKGLCPNRALLLRPPPMSRCHLASATYTCWARPGWYPGCARSWPTAGCRAARSRRRPTGAAARPTPATASPPRTADRAPLRVPS